MFALFIVFVILLAFGFYAVIVAGAKADKKIQKMMFDDCKKEN